MLKRKTIFISYLILYFLVINIFFLYSQDYLIDKENDIEITSKTKSTKESIIKNSLDYIYKAKITLSKTYYYRFEYVVFELQNPYSVPFEKIRIKIYSFGKPYNAFEDIKPEIKFHFQQGKYYAYWAPGWKIETGLYQAIIFSNDENCKIESQDIFFEIRNKQNELSSIAQGLLDIDNLNISEDFQLVNSLLKLGFNSIILDYENNYSSYRFNNFSDLKRLAEENHKYLICSRMTPFIYDNIFINKSKLDNFLHYRRFVNINKKKLNLMSSNSLKYEEYLKTITNNLCIDTKSSVIIIDLSIFDNSIKRINSLDYNIKMNTDYIQENLYKWWFYQDKIAFLSNIISKECDKDFILKINNNQLFIIPLLIDIKANAILIDFKNKNDTTDTIDLIKLKDNKDWMDNLNTSFYLQNTDTIYDKVYKQKKLKYWDFIDSYLISISKIKGIVLNINSTKIKNEIDKNEIDKNEIDNNEIDDNDNNQIFSIFKLEKIRRYFSILSKIREENGLFSYEIKNINYIEDHVDIILKFESKKTYKITIVLYFYANDKIVTKTDIKILDKENMSIFSFAINSNFLGFMIKTNNDKFPYFEF